MQASGSESTLLQVDLADYILAGDVHVLIKMKETGFTGQVDKKICAFWFHTSFMDLNTETIDKRQVEE